MMTEDREKYCVETTKYTPGKVTSSSVEIFGSLSNQIKKVTQKSLKMTISNQKELQVFLFLVCNLWVWKDIVSFRKYQNYQK